MSAAEDDTVGLAGATIIVDPDHEFAFEVGFEFKSEFEFKRGDEAIVSGSKWVVIDRRLMKKRNERAAKEYYKLECYLKSDRGARTFTTSYWLTVDEVHKMME